MTVYKIVSDYLEKNGFDGLYSPGGCACKLDELIPCEGAVDCEPGYLEPCDCGEHSFHIVKKKAGTNFIRERQ